MGLRNSGFCLQPHHQSVRGQDQSRRGVASGSGEGRVLEGVYLPDDSGNQRRPSKQSARLHHRWPELISNINFIKRKSFFFLMIFYVFLLSVRLFLIGLYREPLFYVYKDFFWIFSKMLPSQSTTLKGCQVLICRYVFSCILM